MGCHRWRCCGWIDIFAVVLFSMILLHQRDVNNHSTSCMTLTSTKFCFVSFGFFAVFQKSLDHGWVLGVCKRVDIAGIELMTKRYVRNAYRLCMFLPYLCRPNGVILFPYPMPWAHTNASHHLSMTHTYMSYSEPYDKTCKLTCNHKLSNRSERNTTGSHFKRESGALIMRSSV